jgi:murein DD-endopeptidase MepM/ murein hydrolase activator NlpD
VLYKNNKSGKPDILAAEFNSRGSNYQAIRYTDRNGHTSYYNPQGHSLSASATGGLTRFPVQYKRISSYFSYRRYDPVLHRVHQHPGLDLAAPRGTPIKSIGEGRVKFIGRKGGYGNAVIVSYPHNYTALFGHMSQFPRGLRTNSVVHQGQVIGYVGSTGFATGPHVHYEVHVNGIPRDPLKVTLPPAGVIDGKDRLRFMNQAKTMLAQLQTSQRSQLAANNVNVKIKE